MPRMFVDVTQLAHWGGSITGIPRVMNELAMRFRQDDPNTVFVVWVKEIREFCEINLEETLAHRGHGIRYLMTGQSQPGLVPVSEEAETITGTPAMPPKDLLKRVAKAGVRRGARVNRRLAGALEERGRQWQLKRYKRAEFGRDDTLFIPWGEWWDENFIIRLEELHQRPGVRLIQILHDMSPIVVPQFSNSGNATETFPIYCRRIMPITSLVLSVSQNSERDARRWLEANKLTVPPIRVFRLGDDIKISHPEKPDDQSFKQSGLKGDDYLLFVGTIELKKNHQLMYYVYKLAKARGIELPKLVIAGRLGWMTEATYELMTKDPEVCDKFVFQLNKSDEQLSWLYKHCLFTVLPSFYEGWGIPIAESVARGVPCLCSNTSSMTEIAEEYVEHFSPMSTDECLSAITRWLKPATLEKVRTRTRKYVPYTWDQSYEQVKIHIKEL